ncbi:hypothetical protein BCR44DRAFT_271457 [Catenaria anguillulae PL171]|uniref:Uncharacterized protein n=1 Tax=Catenaria anguillulae PL171 TaxID=765915 RepID=A0A1Y2H502_9FUNG|nr:hypothetical protein BCR44DRAFT_271457 [Catenaria anguillulae PL171]
MSFTRTVFAISLRSTLPTHCSPRNSFDTHAAALTIACDTSWTASVSVAISISRRQWWLFPLTRRSMSMFLMSLQRPATMRPMLKSLPSSKMRMAPSLRLFNPSCVTLRTCLLTRNVLHAANIPADTREFIASVDQIRTYVIEQTGEDMQVASFPIGAYGDDHGSQSKSQNKNHKWELGFPSLEYEYQPLFSQFLSSSRAVDGVVMGHVAVDQIFEEVRNGLVVWDAHLRKRIFVFSSLLLLKADNPMHAACCGGQAGNGAVNLCRVCYATSETANRIAALRTIEQTLATRPAAVDSPFFSFPPAEFDPHRSMPLETLHTVLLGTVKYAANLVLGILRDPEFAFLWQYLLAHNWAAYSRPIPKNPRYFRSHLGRELRYVAQGLPFMMVMIEERFPDRVWTVETWMVVARICFIAKLLYRDSVPADTDNVLTFTVRGLMNLIVASQDEAIRALAVKPKFHLLLHADTFQTLFGPLKHSCATEREESRIGHTKSNIANSNRHATSCDMSKRYAEIVLIRHLTLGGYDPQHPQLGRILGEECFAEIQFNTHLRHLLDLPPIADMAKEHGTPSKAIRSPRSRRPIKHRIQDLNGYLRTALQNMADANEDFPDRGWEHWKAVTLSGKLVNAAFP